MKSIGRIIGILALFVFISWQSAYSQGFGGLTSGISQKLGSLSEGIKTIGSKTLDNIGTNINIKSIKSTTGDFVGKHTHSSIGGKVKASRWRDAATVSGFRKAVGIVAGTAHGALGGSKDDASSTTIKFGGINGDDIAQGFFYNNPGQESITLKYKSLSKSDQSANVYIKGDTGIKKIPVFTDSTGNQLTQEFMNITR